MNSDIVSLVAVVGGLRLKVSPFHMIHQGSPFFFTGGEFDVSPFDVGYVCVSIPNGTLSIETDVDLPDTVYLDMIQSKVDQVEIKHRLVNQPYTTNVDADAATLAEAEAYTDAYTDAQLAAHALVTSGVHGLAITAGKTLTVTESLTFTGTAGATLNIGSGGTLGTAAYTAATAYEVPLTFSGGLSRSVNTITPGALTPISAAFTGTGGAGFVSILSQSSTPSAPASGYVEFADATGRRSWRRALDGFIRTLDATLTADRVYTLKDATGTIPLLETANEFTARVTIPTGTGADPALKLTGTTSGLWNRGAGVVGIAVNGTDTYSFGASTFTLISSSALISLNSDAFISRKAAANVQLGGVDVASPVAQTISVQSVVAGTTDTAGVNLTYNASRGTGTGVGGGHIFQVAPAGTTGTSQNALVTALTIAGSGAITAPINGALSAPAVSITGTPITGGSATTTKPLVLIETSGATSTAWTTSGTMFGINAPNAFAGSIFECQLNGVSRLTLNSAGALTSANNIVSGNNVQIASSSQLSWLGGRGILTSSGSGQIQFGAADAAAPVAQTISVQSVVAGTTNTAGVSTTWAASRGTGTGVGGSHLFQVAPAGSTGSSQNALVTAFEVGGNGGVRIGSGGGGVAPYLFPVTGVSSTFVAGGKGLCLYSYAVGNGDCAIVATGNSVTATSGTGYQFNMYRTFAPTSGTAVFNTFAIEPTINQTGGANGITRGIYINPTLTSAADFRAIEVSAGVVQIASSLTTATATGTDSAGNNLTVIPGVGTGTGRAGDLISKTGLTTTTGSTAQTASTRGYASAKFVDLTESVATTLFTLTVGTAAYAGFTCVVTTFATDGTDHQAITSTLTVSAVNKAGTITATIAETAGTTAASAGTLTHAFTVVDNGSGVLAFKDNAASSLTQTILRAKWFITALNSNDAATVTPV